MCVTVCRTPLALIAGAVTICFLLGCAHTAVYPSVGTDREPRANEYVSKKARMTIEGKQYDAESGTLSVPENRREPQSRLIDIPVKVIRGQSSSAIPIFYLTGGPGQSNLDFYLPTWLLEHHDIVLVGYRGVDGSVRLDMPEVPRAFTRMTDPLSRESLKIFAEAIDTALIRLKDSGVDVTAYTVVDVVDDVEALRSALGYEAINLLSQSYGTRLAYLYGLRYPDRIRRSILIGVNPPGCFVWEPDLVERQLAHYAGLWAADPVASQKSPDILATMREVMASLPKDWFFIRINPDKIRLLSFICLYFRNRNSMLNAQMVFDAFVAAKRGDYSGLAMMSCFFDGWGAQPMVWGDSLLKAGSADFDPERDYVSEMDPPGSTMGSPFAKFSWGGAQLMETGITLIPEEYRRPRESVVPTLMISGSIDFSTPAENATKLLPYLKNGRQVVLSEFGHTGDVWSLQPEALKHLVLTYYEDGTVDDTMYRYEPMDFTPKTSFQTMAKVGVAGIVGIAVLAAAGTAVGLYFHFDH
jgi:pimeloyl-ACP methyl ester carboxylesterase